MKYISNEFAIQESLLILVALLIRKKISLFLNKLASSGKFPTLKITGFWHLNTISEMRLLHVSPYNGGGTHLWKK